MKQVWASKNFNKNTNYPKLQATWSGVEWSGLDHRGLTLHVSVPHHIPTLLLTCLQNPAIHPTPQGFKHSTSKTGTILSPLPKLFLFSAWYPTSSATNPPSYTSHCYHQLSPLWCLTANHIYQASLHTSSWMVHKSTASSSIRSRLGHHQPLPGLLLEAPIWFCWLMSRP